MTNARSTQIDLGITQYFHCITRCVRRSYLCGIDNYSGVDYSHRKQWVVDRVKKLNLSFAIKTCAYGVLTNHYHLVLHVDENETKQWSDEEVVERWKQIYPKNVEQYQHVLKDMRSFGAQQKIALWRERLTSISWFMKCLNEDIAKKANQEDECKGRFWESRFKCQPLLDLGAVLTAMIYVDLNPIRAGIADSLQESDYTSIQERILYAAKEVKYNYQVQGNAKSLDEFLQPKTLVKFGSQRHCIEKYSDASSDFSIPFKLSDYINLVESTGKIVRHDKKGFLPTDSVSLLEQLNLNPDNWLTMLEKLEGQTMSAVGAEILLINFAQRRGKKFKGQKSSRVFYKDGV